jgi:hypothetical protein
MQRERHAAIVKMGLLSASSYATQSVSTRSSSDSSQDEDYCSFFDDDDDFYTVEFTKTMGHTIPRIQEVKRGWIQSTYISMFGMCGLFEDDADAAQEMRGTAPCKLCGHHQQQRHHEVREVDDTNTIGVVGPLLIERVEVELVPKNYADGGNISVRSRSSSHSLGSRGGGDCSANSHVNDSVKHSTLSQHGKGGKPLKNILSLKNK